MKPSKMTNERIAEELIETIPHLSDEALSCTDADDILREAAARLRNLGEIGEAVGRQATREKSSQVGNAMKMREALRGLLEIVCVDCKSSYEIDGKCVKCPRVVAAEAALSAPPRNCDVGTVAEQNERFDKYCYDHRSHEICCGKCPIFGEPCCELAWSQMPYEEGGAK